MRKPAKGPIGSTFPVFHWPQESYSGKDHGKDHAKRRSAHNVLSTTIPYFNVAREITTISGSAAFLPQRMAASASERRWSSRKMISPRNELRLQYERD
jgi:hypothetical protein